MVQARAPHARAALSFPAAAVIAFHLSQPPPGAVWRTSQRSPFSPTPRKTRAAIVLAGRGDLHERLRLAVEEHLPWIPRPPAVSWNRVWTLPLPSSPQSWTPRVPPCWQAQIFFTGSVWPPRPSAVQAPQASARLGLRQRGDLAARFGDQHQHAVVLAREGKLARGEILAAREDRRGRCSSRSSRRPGSSGSSSRPGRYRRSAMSWMPRGPLCSPAVIALQPYFCAADARPLPVRPSRRSDASAACVQTQPSRSSMASIRQPLFWPAQAICAPGFGLAAEARPLPDLPEAARRLLRGEGKRAFLVEREQAGAIFAALRPRRHRLDGPARWCAHDRPPLLLGRVRKDARFSLRGEFEKRGGHAASRAKAQNLTLRPPSALGARQDGAAAPSFALEGLGRPSS